MSRLIRAVIDTHALRSNLEVVRKYAPHSRVMAVVKANAYGHGLVPTALALAEADAFAVARIEEGITLRAAGVEQPIVLLEGAFTAEQLSEAAQYNFDLVVHHPVQIELLEKFASPHRFVLWLKIDTGMNRLGFRTNEFPAALERIQSLAHKPLDVRLLTHLARADEHEVSMTRQQVQRFEQTIQTVNLKSGDTFSFATSIGNSAGLLGWPETRGDWVRPGLALYGVSPFPGKCGADFGLQPVMTLETTVVAIRHVPRGEAVGYGGIWQAPTDKTIAIIAGGYGDGLTRSLDNDTPVLVDGQRAPLVGRVSMDMIAVDVSGIPDVHVGTRCIFWGRNLPVEEVAIHAGTVSYELLCGVSQRVPLEIL